MATVSKILILSPFFSPNIGGVESHLDDLVAQLNQHKIKSYVLTYSPLTTKTKYLSRESRGLCQITRFKWFGYQLFPKLEKYPILDFLYLTPYLFFRSFLWLISNRSKINIIHSQGFNAATAGNLLAKIFNKKHLCSTHAIYENINGFSRYLTVKILNKADHILCLSQKSQEQLVKWGVKKSKVTLYKYWIDLCKFAPNRKPKEFTLLFVGRLITKKGIKVFLQIAKKYQKLKFIVVGNGPLEDTVERYSLKHKNLNFLGGIPNQDLPAIYQQASIFCILSQYPEGFGRVNMEAVASGVPVLGSNLGSIPEALDSSVSILFKPNLKNFVKNIDYLIDHPKKLSQLQRNCRPYAQNQFSSTNFSTILNSYHRLLDIN